MVTETYKPTMGSEMFGTEVMKTDECATFILANIEQGGDPETVLKDMKLIDSLLHVEKLHLVYGRSAAKTRSGNYRKGSTLYDTFNKIIEARVYQDNEELKNIEKP